MNEYLIYANKYYSLGLNVTHISNQLTDNNFHDRSRLKSPSYSWKHLFTIRQNVSEYQSYEWEKATGIGTVTEFDKLVVIDIDGCDDYNIIKAFLKILGLPSDYEWVIQSGSKFGFHIFIKADKLPHIPNDSALSSYPASDSLCNSFKIELLWKSHVVLPPSIHRSGFSYSFINVAFPQKPPETISKFAIDNFLDRFANKLKEKIGSSYHRPIYELKPIGYNSCHNQLIPEDINKEPQICLLYIQNKDNTPRKTFPFWSNTTQIAWIIMDKSGFVYKRESGYIIPNTKPEPISDQLEFNTLLKISPQPKEFLLKLVQDAKNCDYIVAFDSEATIRSFDRLLNDYYLLTKIGKDNVEVICLKNELENYFLTHIPDYIFENENLVKNYNEFYGKNISYTENAEIFIELLRRLAVDFIYNKIDKD